jgi:hypothetical protein
MEKLNYPSGAFDAVEIRVGLDLFIDTNLPAAAFHHGGRPDDSCERKRYATDDAEVEECHLGNIGSKLVSFGPVQDTDSTAVHSEQSVQKTSRGTASLMEGNSVRFWQPGQTAT